MTYDPAYTNTASSVRDHVHRRLTRGILEPRYSIEQLCEHSTYPSSRTSSSRRAADAQLGPVYARVTIHSFATKHQGLLSLPL